MSRQNSVEAAFDQLVAIEPFIEPSTEFPGHYDVFIDVLFGEAEVGTGDPTAELGFRLALRKAEIVGDIHELNQLSFMKGRGVNRSGADTATIETESSSEKNTSARVGFGMSEGGVPMVQGETPGTTTKTIERRIDEQPEIKFQNVPSGEKKTRVFRLTPGKDQEVLTGKPWDADARSLVVKDGRSSDEQENDRSTNNPPLVQFYVRCHARDWDIEFVEIEGRKSTIFRKAKPHAEKILAAREYIREKLIESGLPGGNPEDETAYFYMAQYSEPIP